MAGIGFALQRLSQRNTLASRSMAAGHAIAVTSGPWIVIMAGLALLSYFGRPLLGPDQIKVFHVMVIYSFALSLVITVPIALEATMRVSARLYERQFAKVQAIYFAALAVATALAVAVGCLVFFLWLRLPAPLALASLVCVVQVALLWMAMAFVAAIRQYATVTLAFVLGLTASVVLGTTAATLGFGPEGMLLGFSAGLCLAFCILNALIVGTFPGQLAPMLSLYTRMRAGRLMAGTFVLAGLSSALAVWIDKFIIWQSSEAEILVNGLAHAPRYDTPMFIAYMAILPVMSVLVIWLETGFFDAYRKYRDIIHSGGTLRQINKQRAALTAETVDAIFSAFLIQLAICAGLAIASPLLAHVLGLPLESVPVLRFAFLGAAFHFLFQACCGVILFVQHGRAFLRLQVSFLALNGALTALFLVNPDYLGLGYLIAAIVGGLLAYGVMTHTLGALNRLTFIVNNPSITH